MFETLALELKINEVIEHVNAQKVIIEAHDIMIQELKERIAQLEEGKD